MSHSLSGFFEAKNIAVMGASQKEDTPGHSMARQVGITFKRGDVYFVNIRGGTLFGKSCYKTASDLPPAKIDLAIFVLPAKLTPDAVEELIVKKGCKHFVICSGGFSEVGEEGEKIQARLTQIGQKYGVRIIGPNCVGIYSPADTIDCLFIEQDGATRPLPGKISFATQSGGFGMCMFNELYNLAPKNNWFGRLISLGNSCDVCEADAMEYFEQDEGTEVSTFYVEGFKDAHRFLHSARRSVAKGKPVLVVKAGRTAEGQHALKSHSASLAADDGVTEALLEQHGIIRCDGWKDMFKLFAASLACKQVVKGKRIQIVTNGGGQGVQLADWLSFYGLKRAIVGEVAAAKMSAKFPSFYIIENPLDLTGSGSTDDFLLALEALKDDPSNDAIVLNLLMYVKGIEPERLSVTVAKMFGKDVPNRKPLFAVLIGTSLDVKARCTEIFLSNGIPIFDSEYEAIKCVGAVTRFQEYRTREQEALEELEKSAKGPSEEVWSKQTITKIEQSLAETVAKLQEKEVEQTLPEHIAYTLLDAIGVPVPRFSLAKSGAEAEAFISQKFAGKEGKVIERDLAQFAVKIVSPDVLHKTEAGGVEIGVSGQDGVVGAAVDKMLAKFSKLRVEGCIVTEMVPGRDSDGRQTKGVELIVGMNTDPTFGKVLLAGIGGVLVEALKDVTFGLCPLRSADALQMLQRLRTQALLDDYRGMGKVDRNKLSDLMVRISELAVRFPQIRSMDFNPVIAGQGKVWVVDARVMVGRK